LVIIPLGADKVLLRSPDGGDVISILSEAPDFFNLFFSNPTRWNKEGCLHERGAWVRIYGVPLHAWNFEFFKLCIMDCGRLLRVDDSSLGKERLDYARVLASTSSLEILNLNTSVLIDGVLSKLNIIEEWGFSLCEDACLIDDDANSVEVNSNFEVQHDNAGDCGDVNDLIQKLSEAWDQDTDQKFSCRYKGVQGAVNGNKETEFIDSPTAECSPLIPMQPQAVQPSSAPTVPLVQPRTQPATERVPGVVTAPDVVSNSERAKGSNSLNFLNQVGRAVKRTSSCPQPGIVR